MKTVYIKAYIKWLKAYNLLLSRGYGDDPSCRELEARIAFAQRRAGL